MPHRGANLLERLASPAAVGAATALAIAGLFVALPLVCLLVDAVFGGGVLSPRTPGEVFGAPELPSGAGELLLRSAGLAFGAAIVGALLAWPASRAARRGGLAGWRVVPTALLLLPLALPPWLLFAAIWLSVGPGTVIGDLVERENEVGVLRMVALLLATVVWSSAPAFAVLVLGGPRSVGRSARLLALDDAGLVARVRAAFAEDARALFAAIAGAGIFLLSETTVYDLALVPTYGFELRAREALGATPLELVLIAWPAELLAMVAVALAASMLVRGGFARLRERGVSGAIEPHARIAPTLWVAALPAALFLGLFAGALGETPRPGDFLRLHGGALATSIVVAVGAAFVVAVFATALRLAFDAVPTGRRNAAMTIAIVAAAAGALGGLLPGAVLVSAVESAYNRDLTWWIYDGPVVVVLILAARAAVVAPIVVVASLLSEPRHARELRALDGEGFGAILRTDRRALRRSASASFILALAWCLGELTASGRLAPPGLAWIATDVLNAIHYQRAETVLLAAIALLMVAFVGAWVAARVLEQRLARTVPRSVSGIAARGLAPVAAGLPAAMLAAAIAIPGCERPTDPALSAPTSLSGEPDPPGFDIGAPKVARTVPVERMLAGVGRGRGQFNGPRVLAVDPTSGDTYVIDKDARVQRFGPDGEQLREWRMPQWNRGKPVGASVAPDGSLVVADTHEHRVVAFSPDGEIRWTLGSYGREPGQFVYPTDVVFAPDGRIFVGEYGGNDRIQVFDSEHRFLYSFGKCGSGPGEFLRPQALALDAARDELYVCDAGNHRVQVLTTDGEFRREIGGTGREEGRFAYPFGLTLLIDGVPVTSGGVLPAERVGSTGNGGSAEDERVREIVVVEHSNHRVQRLDAITGKVRMVVGGIGRESGRLKYPWAVDGAGIGPDGRARFAVCDHGNSRIVFFPLDVAKTR
jgi:ABC-type Fe3+ transport system permease subunit